MAVEILVPKLGLTMTEGIVDQWLVEPGVTVRVGDPLLTLSTDKVDVEVEAEAEGVFHPGVPAGSSLPPGAVIGWLLAEGEQPPTGAGAAPPAAAEAAAPPVAEPGAVVPAAPAADAPSPDGTAPDGRLRVSPNARRVARELGVDLAGLTGTGPGGRIVSEDVEEAAAAAAAALPAAPPAAPVNGSRTSPLVRKLAAQLGVDLTAVVGTGPDGRVTKTDVHLAARPAPAAQPAAAAGGGLTGLRGAIARNMVTSLREMAQLTLGHEADVSALVAARAALKAEDAGSGRRTPTISDFVVRAAALALRDHPTMNATLRDGRIEPNDTIDVGLAVAIEGGLVVPVLRQADQGSLRTLSETAAELAATARAGKLTLPQLEGATFAVSSLGTAGIDFFTPIINPGNVGILGVGRIRDGVRWEGETPRRSSVMTLSLTFDHRVIDGAPAAEYLLQVADLLSRPLGLLAG
ncbi:dihydrolipoamide acetyltransferase family protein [Blastococcus sp. SYSU D00820]